VLQMKSRHVAKFPHCETGYNRYVGYLLRYMNSDPVQITSRSISTFRAVLIFHTPYHYLVTQYGKPFAITTAVWYGLR
jgi:hypothetical protein